MVEAISPQRFHSSPGVEDWRVVFGGASAYFATGSFAVGAQLVAKIAELADAANHHPDVDLRYPGVLVRLTTHEVMPEALLSDRDAALAAQISEAARELGVATDPTKVQTFQLTIDALDIEKVRPFWAAVLGYTERGDGDVVDPGAFAPGISFQQMDGPRPQRNRIHVDVSVPAQLAQARVDAALAAGGSLVTDAHAPYWWTLADPEGNEVDVAPWMDSWTG
ncbi:VOC family protein [Gryllotalpicola ginsengisoli]|uniref:VOC family protein n=1 Tax=Gryllotalpicola ginsengisoli TaxID=444608 RepID=UPI000417A626|nr:VOC family protein [Gryllotalpicola ginsengisoli]